VMVGKHALQNNQQPTTNNQPERAYFI
jgi:hypothetical protein